MRSIADSRVVRMARARPSGVVDAERSAPRIAAWLQVVMSGLDSPATRVHYSRVRTAPAAVDRVKPVTLVAAGRCSACADLL